MKRSIIKSSVLVALVLVIALSFVSASEAQRVKPIVLKGTYGVIGHDVCVGNWLSGGPLGIYWTKTSTIQGTSNFNPDETGTGEFDQLSIVHPLDKNSPGSITTSNISIAYTYSIDPVTREIIQVISGSGRFTSTAEPLAGKYLTFETYTQTGFVSLDKRTIVSSTIPLDPEPDESDFTRIVSIWNDSNHTQLYGLQREICQRNRVSTQIGLQ